MFAEDVGLLPKVEGRGAFTDLLETLSQTPEQFVPLVGALWKEMDEGGFSVVLRQTLPRFNGKLFKHPEVLPLDRAQIELLLKAAQADWHGYRHDDAYSVTWSMTTAPRGNVQSSVLARRSFHMPSSAENMAVMPGSFTGVNHIGFG